MMKTTYGRRAGRRALLTAVLLVLALLLTACGGAGSDSMTVNGEMQYAAGGNAKPMEGKTDSFAASSDMAMPESYPTVDSDIYRDESTKVIRRAELTIQTTEFDQSVAALAALTEAHEGYYEVSRVDSGSLYNQYASRSAYYVVRVPKEQFTAFRDGMGAVGHLHSINESTEDVGEVYYDTEARLATLTTKRERLLALLDRAELMEDIITLESALADVQYEIDQHTGTLRRYDSLIDYATFTIHLDEVIRVTEEPGPEDSFATKLAASLREGLRGFGEGAEDFALWLARNLIGVALLAVVAAGAVVVVRRRYKGRKSRKEASREDETQE